MTIDTEEGETLILSPDDAFATLGNQTRIEILQTLGEADNSLSFSELLSQRSGIPPLQGWEEVNLTVDDDLNVVEVTHR